MIALLRRTGRDRFVATMDGAFADAGYSSPRYLIPYEPSGA